MCIIIPGLYRTRSFFSVRDVLELLDRMSQSDIIPVGHSLGGYTALCISNLVPAVKRAVIISGFVSISDEMMGFVRFRILANLVKRFEKKLDPHYGKLDNYIYLQNTTDKLLWIHSTDDPMVNYAHNAGQVLRTMNAWMGGYHRLIREKQLDTSEARKAYFNEKPVRKMTEQDPAVVGEILRLTDHNPRYFLESMVCLAVLSCAGQHRIDYSRRKRTTKKLVYSVP